MLSPVVEAADSSSASTEIVVASIARSELYIMSIM
jgi:hypothetical protein